ncbi:MAG: hypothetical protein IJK30_07540 [Ruminococcus sp.]|nr:hypothetical protein [Ruminococcus sp.]
MSGIVARHKKVAFFGVVSGNTETFTRMPKFTQLTTNKNPMEYSRQYVDEPFQETDVVGYSPSISYAFDRHRSSVVQDDIVKIHDEELIGDDAVRNIVVVDVETGEAVQRSYAVIPSTEGDNINVYTYSGNFKTKGELIQGTATSSDDWQTCTFTETT